MIVTDPAWCTDDPDLRVLNPFPFWLYSDSDSNISGGCSVRARWDAWCGGSRSGSACATPSAPDGFGITSRSATANSAREHARRSAGGGTTRRRDFPAHSAAGDLLRQHSGHPGRAGDAADDRQQPSATGQPRRGAARQACKTALAGLVAGRPHSNFLDFRVDDALTRDQRELPRLRCTTGRDRAPMEQRIAESLRLGNAGPTTF